jgi:hypothetical protein
MNLLVLLLLAAPASSQQPSTDTISFRLDRPGIPLPSYTLTVHSDGSASYQVSYPPEVPRYSPYAESIKALPNTNITINVTLSKAGTSRLFELVRGTNNFSAGCASKAKHIADTGTKILTYNSSAALATCVYNYTEDKTILALTHTFQAIALTLDEGRKLETSHRYDRLALDPETEFLIASAKEGTAAEFGAIAPTLKSIADDPQVLERVRTRAAELLAQAATNP